MTSHSKTAAAVRQRKEKNPALYCRQQGCLWRLADFSLGLYCPKHGGARTIPDTFHFANDLISPASPGASRQGVEQAPLQDSSPGGGVPEQGLGGCDDFEMPPLGPALDISHKTESGVIVDWLLFFQYPSRIQIKGVRFL